jgi:UDPglucose--hexose-1-phosphate uridylyltransferase
MGLAVLPSRLKKELSDLAAALAADAPLTGDLEKHAAWAEGLKQRYSFTAENALDILLKETGRVFAGVLEDAGVYKNDERGEEAFRRFVAAVNA